MTNSISVVWPTYRIGGLDLLEASWKAQDFQGNHEWLCVDRLCRARPWYPDRLAYRFPPYVVPSPRRGLGKLVYSVCRDRNIGIHAAHGDTIVLTVDWTLASQGWLRSFHEAVQTDPGAVWVGRHPCYPVTRADIPDFGGSIRRYLAWIDTLPSGDPRWFRLTYEAARESLPGACYWDFVHGDDVHPRHFFAKNFAAQRELLLSLSEGDGIFDERFDGARGLDDWDLADRIVAKGHRIRFCEGAEIAIYKPNADVIPIPLHDGAGNGYVFGRDVGVVPPEEPLRILHEKGQVA